MSRIEKLEKIMKNRELDLMYISSKNTIFYFLDIKIEPLERYLAFIVYKNKKYLIIPLLDLDKVKKVENIEIIAYKDGENPYSILLEKIKCNEISKLGIDSENISLNKFLKFKEIFNISEILTIDEDIKKILLYKDDKEVENIRIACKYADMCIEIAENNLREGISEIELKNIIEKEIQNKVDTYMSFDTMVLFSENASLPHGESGSRKLKQGDMVLLDLGCYYNNYSSDITRVLKYGETSEFFNEIYDIVLEANMEAIKNCKIGMKFSELDKIARDIITKKGYGEYFTHRLGHGLGITCHEYPDVSSYNDLEIQEGMVFTIEPGIYLKDKIGIRIEDDVYIGKNGVEVLTKYKK